LTAYSLLRKRLRLLAVGARCESDAVAVAEECEPVRIDEQALAGAIELIAHDLTATLGWDGTRAQAEARDALDTRMEVLRDDLPWEQLDPASRQEVLEHLVVEAVEQLQQLLHDTFVDTTWPTCPRHRQHPL
jgi:hypothetical protein